MYVVYRYNSNEEIEDELLISGTNIIIIGRKMISMC